MTILIIFDCDGVLLDSERILNDVFRECLKEIGLELSLNEVIKRFKGRSTLDCLKIAESMLGRPISSSSISGRYEEISARRFRNEIKAIDGITEVLEKCNPPITNRLFK